MCKVRAVLALLVLALLVLVSPCLPTTPGDTADSQHDGNPCPPCHCGDDILDCSGVDLRAAPIEHWNTSAFTFQTVNLDGAVRGQLQVLPALPGARVLSLRSNRLAKMETAAFVHLPNLTTLDLSWNQLSADAVRADVLRGPWRVDSYEPLMLEVLDLSHNALHSLPRRALEHLPQLRQLRLDGNPLKVLDHGTQDALASVPGLQVLGLASCGLTTLPDSLDAVLGRQLTTLDLSRNQLRTVPTGLPTSLRRLDLDGNPIQRLPPADTLEPPFVHLANLEQLSVSYMPLLEEIAAGAFFGLLHLRVLSCSDNPSLRDIHPDAFSHLGPSWGLTEVSLRNNSLKSVLPATLAWRGLSFLDMSGNPWHCSCNFSRWATNTLQSVNLNSRDNYRCSSPSALAGQSLWNVTAACSPAARPAGPAGSRVTVTGPSLLANALVLVMTMGLVTSVVLLIRRFLLYQRRRTGDKVRVLYSIAPQDMS